MSIRVMTRVWAESQHCGTYLLMLLAIADFADEYGHAYPAVATLARKCRMKPRNAGYILRALEKSGELQVSMNQGRSGANRYRVVLDGLDLQANAGGQGGAGLHPVARLQSDVPTPAIEGTSPLQSVAGNTSGTIKESSRRTSQRTSMIGENWQPSDDLRAWASNIRADLDLVRVVENFRNHYVARGEARASWDATFRAWVLRERGLTTHIAPQTRRHSGFDKMDYSAGIRADGSPL